MIRALPLLLLAGAAMVPATASAGELPLSVKPSFRLGDAGVLCTAQIRPTDKRLSDIFDRSYMLTCRDAAAPIGSVLAVRHAVDPINEAGALPSSQLACQPEEIATVDNVGAVRAYRCRDAAAGVDYRRYAVQRGKTTYLAQKLNNKGILIALDPSKKRIRSTFFNLMRCGVRNTLVYHMDATNVFQLGIRYDRVLLDAPCSCEGVIARDKSILDNHYPELINKCAERQRALIHAAIKVTKPGGLIVYSTCTFAPEENEIVINTMLDRYDNIEIEPVAIGENGLTTFGLFSLNPSLKYTRRLYPHIHGTLGFYIAKLRVKNVSV